MPALPDIPDDQRNGARGSKPHRGSACFAPAGTPKDMLERIAKIVRDALGTADVRDKMMALGMVPVPRGPDEFDRLIAEDLKFWQAAVETDAKSKRQVERKPKATCETHLHLRRRRGRRTFRGASWRARGTTCR